MSDPTFHQIMPAGDWLAEYKTSPFGRRYERVVAFVLGSFPAVAGEFYQYNTLVPGIDGFDGERRLCSTLPNFVRFVRLEDLDPERQADIRLGARPPRPQAKDVMRELRAMEGGAS